MSNIGYEAINYHLHVGVSLQRFFFFFFSEEVPRNGLQRNVDPYTHANTCFQQGS